MMMKRGTRTRKTSTLTPIRELLSPVDYKKLLERIKDDPATWLPPGYRAPT